MSTVVRRWVDGETTRCYAAGMVMCCVEDVDRNTRMES